MSMKMVKKFIAVTMAATLMVAPAITASAATETSAPVEATTEVKAESTVNVAGTVLKSQTAGAYSVKTLAGLAVREAPATIKAAAGMAANETPFVRAYDITAKKSPAAFASFDAAAGAVGATVLGALNIDLGKMAAGKFSDLPAGVAATTTVGVKNANGRTLAIVKVLPGGATEIIQDTDDNPNTVTFPITGGLAAYAVIAY